MVSIVVRSQETCSREVSVAYRAVVVQLLNLVVPVDVTFEKILFRECLLASIALELLVLFRRVEYNHVARQPTFIFERTFTLQAVFLLHCRASMAFDVLQVEWLLNKSFVTTEHEAILVMGSFEVHI